MGFAQERHHHDEAEDTNYTWVQEDRRRTADEVLTVNSTTNDEEDEANPWMKILANAGVEVSAEQEAFLPELHRDWKELFGMEPKILGMETVSSTAHPFTGLLHPDSPFVVTVNIQVCHVSFKCTTKSSHRRSRRSLQHRHQRHGVPLAKEHQSPIQMASSLGKASRSKCSTSSRCSGYGKSGATGCTAHCYYA